jgi:uncharacterized membrane protein YqaE (UPF0057 family)
VRQNEKIIKIYLSKKIKEYKTNEIYNIISNKFQLKNKDFFLKIFTKIIPINDNLFLKNKCFLNGNNYNDILVDLHIRIKGGIDIGGAMDGMLDKITEVFEPVAKPVMAIGDFFIMIGKAILFIVKLAIWVIRLVIWVAIEFLNPIKIFTDLFGSITRITKLIIVAGLDMIMALFRFFLNKIFGFIFDGNLYGWDQNTYNKEQQIKKERMKKNKQKFKDIKKDNFSDTYDDDDDLDNDYDLDNDDDDKEGLNNEKCYKTPPGQIPFSIIIMSILCPPLGIFMQYGLSYWLNIVICSLLTLMYYIPGLLYCLILLYC